ncbi:uncharacterized protein K441DRAFT_658912 [Cenococcum geophilum 1.58]|uniref:uncharacterized protein n=1 Tax=Cenococcum geophilum 1.58 TaxID=794803 RepID=UPI00358F42FE|nr:hypothetical protein K441DRAFT_658912 [Cenococcum geophilum 1.58]
MGDIPTDTGFQPLESSSTDTSQDEIRTSAKVAPGGANNPSPSELRSPSNNAPFYSQFSSIPQPQPRLAIPRASNQQGNTFYDVSPGQELSTSSFNMGAVIGALPEYPSVVSGESIPQAHKQDSRALSGASTSALVYQLQQISQFPGHSQGSYQGQSPYSPTSRQGQYPTNFVASQSAQQTAYQQFNPNQQRSASPNPLQPLYPSFQQQPLQYLYYTSPCGPQIQFTQNFPAQVPQQPTLYNRRASLPSAQVPVIAQSTEPTTLSGSYPSANRLASGGFSSDYGCMSAFPSSGDISRPGSEANINSIPRGPPRKPKQSGHALWVGNLPQETTVMDLKDHFSRDATKDIESLFLISKSNCAFVNYRTEASCVAAMHRFHDSRFHGVRLVCRLRRSSALVSGVPIGPSAMSGPRESSTFPQRSPQLPEGEEVAEEPSQIREETTGSESATTSRIAEKFFIVKSLTLQDLELSVRNGIWATQSHNEEALNKAYEAADNVYLIFSANKSGEYFGYARMASSIHQDTAQIMETVPKPENLDSTDVPKSIPTPATEHAPKGRIIDDSARGTIFWEADISDVQEDGVKDKEEDSAQADADTSATAQTWGKPFKIEWISTNRLPFYRTRGLRNPWNANREVKIARDGTELETSVGKRLIQMFHRLGPLGAGPPALPMMQMLPQMDGPQTRPY